MALLSRGCLPQILATMEYKYNYAIFALIDFIFIDLGHLATVFIPWNNIQPQAFHHSTADISTWAIKTRSTLRSLRWLPMTTLHQQKEALFINNAHPRRMRMYGLLTFHQHVWDRWKQGRKWIYSKLSFQCSKVFHAFSFRKPGLPLSTWGRLAWSTSRQERGTRKDSRDPIKVPWKLPSGPSGDWNQLGEVGKAITQSWPFPGLSTVGRSNECQHVSPIRGVVWKGSGLQTL